MKNLYLAIKARIEAMVPEILFIHMYNNQIDTTADGTTYSYLMPALFVEFENDQEPKQLGNGVQIYEPLLVKIHIAVNQLDAGDGTLEQNLNVFILTQKVFAALQKFEPDGAVMFIRSGETEDYDHDNIYHFIQTYTTSYVDVQQKEPVKGVPNVPPLSFDLTAVYDIPDAGGAAQIATVAQYIKGVSYNEMVDIGPYGLNLDIINNDIELQSGFPYKSNALIAQKATSYGKVPDPTNFWFTTLGVPNQIPVVSLFQNIDYKDQIFCKHQDQVLNTAGEETTEPQVTEIVTYYSRLAGTQLTAAYTYFNVPAKTAAAIWVDGVNGNDSTGTGAELLPYKTLTKANTGTANKTIYVKTASYADTASIFFAGNQNWYFIGYCPCTNTATPAFSTSASNNVFLQGAIITPALGGRALYLISGNNNTIYRCKLNVNGTSSKNFQVLDGTGNVLKYCILPNSVDTPNVDIRKVACDIYGCIFTGTKAAATDVVSFNTTAITGTQNILYNKFSNTLSTNRYLFLFNTAGNYNIKYNKIRTDGGYGIHGLLSGASMTGNINYSYNDFQPTNLVSHIILSSDPTNVINYTILFNYIKLVSGALTNGVIGLVGQPPPVINFNYIDVNMYTGGITVSATSVKGPCDISYNTVLLRADGSHIVLGNDLNTTYDHAYDGSTIIGNKLYGIWYFNPNSATNLSHGIAIYNSVDCKVKYNYSNGANHVIVYKAGDRATAMVNTDAIVSFNVGVNNDGSLFPKTMSGIKFYNNTTYADNPNIKQMAGGIYVLSNPGPAINNVFKNNIFVDKTPANSALSIIRIDLANALPGFVCNNNIIYSKNNKVANLANVYYTFAQWQGLGYDANSLYQDANLKSPSLEQLWPFVPITQAEAIGAPNNVGLDVSTAWPTIVTKNQPAIYQNGAYIQ